MGPLTHAPREVAVLQGVQEPVWHAVVELFPVRTQGQDAQAVLVVAGVGREPWGRKWGVTEEPGVASTLPGVLCVKVEGAAQW